MIGFIMDENKRSAIAWVVAGIAAILGFTFEAHKYLTAPPDISLVDVRPVENFYPEENIRKAGLTLEMAPIECGPMFYDFEMRQVIDKKLCEQSDFMVHTDAFTPQYALDLTIQNNSDKTIVISQASYVVTKAFNVYHSPGADSVESLKVKTKAVLSATKNSTFSS